MTRIGSEQALLRLPDVDALIALINEGAFDTHLEDLLAAAHGRKRERRGRRVPYGVLDLTNGSASVGGSYEPAPTPAAPYPVAGFGQQPRPIRQHVVPGRATS